MAEATPNERVFDATVIVPALNESSTIGEVVERLLALPLRLQIVVVDDGSTDDTPSILAGFASKIEVVTNPRPGGKGMAIRSALPLAKGEAVIIQDADLEYRPEDIPKLIQPILDGECDVVYGTRFSTGLPKNMALPNKLVNVLLAWSVRVLFFVGITDEATCYKAFRRQVLLDMNLSCTRFEFCPEVTAKAIRLGRQIREIPIAYEPRTKSAGKKIRWTDAPIAFWTLLKHRFSSSWRKKG